MKIADIGFGVLTMSPKLQQLLWIQTYNYGVKNEKVGIESYNYRSKVILGIQSHKRSIIRICNLRAVLITLSSSYEVRSVALILKL